MDEAAEAVAALDGGRWWAHHTDLPRWRIGRCGVQCAVRLVAVVVVDETPEDAFEVALVHDQHPVKAL